MYHSTGVQKLSETQKSKLRNGHPVRIKKGSGNNLHLTDDQIKKLESAAKKGAAYTLTMHPEQAAKHKTGEGLFGDIAAKAKAFARKHKDLINPIIGRVRAGAKSGIDKLASKANAKVDEYIKPIEGEGIIGDALKGLIGMTGLGVKPKTLKSTLKSRNILHFRAYHNVFHRLELCHLRLYSHLVYRCSNLGSLGMTIFFHCSN